MFGRPGFVTWRRDCVCPDCSQDCRKVGRLERSSNIEGDGPPEADYVTGHVDR